MTHDIVPLWFCVDCTTVAEFGQEDLNAEIPIQESIQGLERLTENGAHLAIGDGDDDRDFSWSRCDCCHSSLGGYRHAYNLIVPQEEIHGTET